METNRFDAFIEQAWDEHAADPAAVAGRLAATGPLLVRDGAELQALARLVHHVHGEHLARYAAGRELLQSLATHPACDAGAAAAIRRFIASLDLSAGDDGALDGLAAADRICAGALAAANLAGRDTARAGALFRQALDAAEVAQVDRADPIHRALAVCANNLACTLEEMPGRSVAERELMILAAQAARRCWAIAGTWLHVERAEYRLALSWLQAGDAARARHHAQACLALVDAHGGVALERFAACEALALSARAAADDAGWREACAQAEAACAGLSGDERAQGEARLAALRG